MPSGITENSPIVQEKIQEKMREFKRSRCIFIDLGLVRAAPSITVV